MKRTIHCAVICILTISPCLYGTIYDLQNTSSDGTRKLRLNIPESVQEVRGLLINGNGASMDETGQATNSELVAYAESIGFAVLATGNWAGFWFADDFEILLFESMIEDFAATSGHPELIYAPWLPMGHSNGGQMSYGLNAKRPSKVIGFITSKGRYYNDFVPETAALQTPGMLVAGNQDTQERRDSIKSLLDINRPRGALWAWVEEENSGHEEKDSQQLKLTFLAECVRLRYPPDQSPLDGPVTLKSLHECDGWLVDHSTWSTGLTSILPYEEGRAEKHLYGWVPNEKIARYYQAFSSYNKVTMSVTGNSGLVTAPATLTYSPHIILTAGRGVPAESDIPTISFLYNGVIISEGPVPLGVYPSISVEQIFGGFQAFSSIVTYPDGSQSATPLRRVFVRGTRPPSAFEQWAQEYLPADVNGPDDTLFDDGIRNIERFAFGLSLTEPVYGFEPLQPAEPFIEQIDGTQYRVYTYQVNEQALASGLNIMPQVSLDQNVWTNIVNIDDPYVIVPPKVDRTGPAVTVKYPDVSEELFFRIQVSDTYEGL